MNQEELLVQLHSLSVQIDLRHQQYRSECQYFQGSVAAKHKKLYKKEIEELQSRQKNTAQELRRLRLK